MAKIKPESAYATAVFGGFPGLNAEKERDGTAAAVSMVNFRPLADGSLKKRCGCSQVIEMPGTPRAVFSGYLNGESVFYFLVEDKIYRRCADNENGYEYVGIIGNAYGDAQFAEFLGKLYLFDGTEIFVMQDYGFVVIEGYIPLYGKNWDPVLLGDVFEEENLLTKRVRIHYRNPNFSDTLYFGRRVVSIDSILLEGVRLDPGEAQLLSTGYGCICEGFQDAMEIELVVSLDGIDSRAKICSCRRALVYGGARDNRIFCWQGSDSNAIFGSRAVLTENAERSEELGGFGGAIYFPADSSAYRLDAPVTAVCRSFDRMMIFSASGAWAAECSGDSNFEAVPVHVSVGCDKKDCAVLCGNIPVTYFGGKLWRWTAGNRSSSEWNAEAFSAPVGALVSAMHTQTVLMQYYGESSELFLTCAEDSSGRILIYNDALNLFYTFEGIPVDRTVASDGEVLLIYGNALMRLDEACAMDFGSREIAASYVSGWMDFGHPERTKHLIRCFLEGDPCGGKITVSFESERGKCAAIDLVGTGEALPNAYDRRIAVGRFRYVRFSVTAEGEERSVLSRMTVTARK